ISPHGVGIALGFLYGSWWMLREGPKRGLDERNVSNILFWALIGAIVGARVFYVVAHWGQFSGHPVDIVKVYNGGINLRGGFAVLTNAAGHVLAKGIGVHQTALYDFISTILLFLFLVLFMNRRVWREGVMICTWAVWYLGVRVWTDFLRVDKRFFGLTGSQW